MLDNYSSMGQVIDSPIEDLTKELDKLTFGELTSFKKMMEMQYQELVYTKDELNKLENKEESEPAINNVYMLMQKVEDIATVCEELKNQREVRI